MQVKDLNDVLKRCGFNTALNEKPINIPVTQRIFLKMASNIVNNETVTHVNDVGRIAESIRFLAIAIYLLESDNGS